MCEATLKAKMLAKIRALFAKTEAQGATEAEALSAIAKAEELMREYEIDASALGTEQETEQVTIEKREYHMRFNSHYYMVAQVGRFCQVKGWKNTDEDKVAFCGYTSEAIFAHWLLDTLARFVDRRAAQFTKENPQLFGSDKRSASHSFIIGCVSRINERLKEINNARDAARQVIGSTSLVVSRQAKINRVIADAGLRFRNSASNRRYRDSGAFGAGRAAGDAAQFNRPVGSANGPLALSYRPTR